MTIEEWMEKADYEGGIEEAVFNYGLSEKDLDVQEGDFYEAVKALVALRPQVTDLVDEIYKLGDGYE